MADTLERNRTTDGETETRASRTGKRPGTRRTSRRKAILGLGALGVVGAGALAAPIAIPAIEREIQHAEAEFLAQQLGKLAGVPLDAAIEAAEITRAAVKVFVVPLAEVFATLDAGALTGLIDTLNLAHNLIADVHGDTREVDALRKVLISWRNNVNQLPISVQAYSTADINGAETYLKALKSKTQAQ